MSTGRTLYLVDGTYLLFRAYHSLPPSMAVTGPSYEKNRAGLIAALREGAGTRAEPPGVADAALAWLEDPGRDRIPTNAVRGLVSVLLKLIREEKPTYLGVAFDLPGLVHRDEHYASFVGRHPDYAGKLEGYKATRPETPVEIHVQFPLARLALARGLGIPVLEAAGFEADDLIGTLARRARDRGFTVLLVTADKDLFQLVEDGISILNPHKPDPARGRSYLLMDAAVVEKEFGVPPAQVVDVLALMGDASDNIPGVPGIGEKGARELVRRFGTVEGCLDAAKEEGLIARPAYRKGLLEHAALALFSKELATIREDAPIEVNLDDVWTHSPDKERLREVFGLLSFEGLLRDAETLPPAPGIAAGGATGGTAAGMGPAGIAAPGEATPAAAAGPTKAGKKGRTGRSRPAEEQGSFLFREEHPVPAPEGEEKGGPEAGAGESRNERFFGAEGGQHEIPAGAADPGGTASAGSREGGEARALAPGRHEGDDGHGALSGGAGSVEWSEDAERYRLVLDTAELAGLLPAILAAPRVAVDTETTSEDPMRAALVGISIAWEPHRAIYVPVGHRYLGAPEQPARAEVLRLLAPLLESPWKVKTGQNVKYDVEVLRRAGAKPAAFSFDTMIAAFLVDPDRPSFSLGVLAKEYLGDYKIPFAEVTGKGAKNLTFDQVEVGRAAVYSGRDADVTLRLAGELDRRLGAESLHRVFDEIDMPLIEVLADMELAGVRIDLELLARLSREMGAQIAALRSQIHGLAGHEFNVDSPRQLATVLFEELRLPPISRTAKSGVSSTRDEDLEILAARHPLPAKVRDYRALAKLRSTYVDALPAMVNPETGRVHTSFHPTGAATGRLSSSDPNLQNIPVRTEEGRKIRAAFVPEPGWTMVSADYSQVELRVMAQISGDPELRATFERGEDIHRLTAARIFDAAYDAVTSDQRRAAKTINFGILYGMGPQRLARDLAIPQARAKELIESYFGRFPRIREYMEGTIAGAERAGYVSTLFGRIRRFPDLVSTSRYQRQLAVRAAVNSTIQGTAADLMKIAMVRLHRAIAAAGLRARILIQVHDELVLEAPPEEMGALEELVRGAMEKVEPFEVPLVVDISSGPNWLEAKP